MTELLIAVVIFGIGVIPLLGYMTSGLKRIAGLVDTNIAMGLATEAMEIVSNRPFDDLGIARTFDMAVPPSQSGTFNRTVEIESLPGKKLSQVTVTVSWDAEKDRKHKVTLVVLVADQSLKR